MVLAVIVKPNALCWNIRHVIAVSRVGHELTVRGQHMQHIGFLERLNYLPSAGQFPAVLINRNRVATYLTLAPFIIVLYSISELRTHGCIYKVSVHYLHK